MSEAKLTQRVYPRDVWVLQPSFKPKVVRIVGSLYSHSDWDKAESGKPHHLDEMFDTKEAAIASGEERIAKMEADIAKRTDSLNKKRAALALARGEKK